jgi:hypothetical protein
MKCLKCGGELVKVDNCELGCCENWQCKNCGAGHFVEGDGSGLTKGRLGGKPPEYHLSEVKE